MIKKVFWAVVLSCWTVAGAFAQYSVKGIVVDSINVGEKMSFGAFMAIFRSKLNEYIKIYLDSA